MRIDGRTDHAVGRRRVVRKAARLRLILHQLLLCLVVLVDLRRALKTLVRIVSRPDVRAEARLRFVGLNLLVRRRSICIGPRRVLKSLLAGRDGLQVRTVAVQLGVSLGGAVLRLLVSDLELVERVNLRAFLHLELLSIAQLIDFVNDCHEVRVIDVLNLLLYQLLHRVKKLVQAQRIAGH